MYNLLTLTLFHRYIFFFQIPWFPERAVRMGDYNMIDEECKHGETTDEDIQAFKYSISRPGKHKPKLLLCVH